MHLTTLGGRLRVAALVTLGPLAFACSSAVTAPGEGAVSASSMADGAAEATPSAPVLVLGRDFALRSSGAARDTAWQLGESGYIGTYLRVERPGTVTLSLEASGTADRGAAPRLQLVLADTARGFDVGRERAPHELEVTLAPGTYLVRVDFLNAAPGSQRELVVHQLAVSGASQVDGHSDQNALDAANTYIRYFRKGPARLELAGVAPGGTIKVKLERHAFGFGANVPFAENKLIPEVVAPGSDAERFQRLLFNNFNTVVLSNGGKWVYHEPERDKVNLAYVDRFLDFVEQNGLTARMHTLIWDTEQQPAWVVSTDSKTPGLLTRAHGGDAGSKQELLEEIDERIDYIVKQRAQRYSELDVLNESLHRPRYWQALGDAGLAEIFSRAAAAVKAAGGKTRLYLNEYNLLQWSKNPLLGENAEPDPYANWYRRHAEAVLGAGGPVTGLGVQYYADGRLPNEINENAHSAARIMGVLQNLSGVGLPLTLSEFAVNPGALPPERGADVLEETLRLVFGTAQANAFLMWATWANAAQKPPPVSILMDEKDELTPAGRRYAALMREWNTELELPVEADGSIKFDGFFGDYALSVGGQTRCFKLTKGQSEYRVENTPAPPPSGPAGRRCTANRPKPPRCPNNLPTKYRVRACPIGRLRAP